MPACAPAKGPDEYWATVKREDTNIVVLQKNDVSAFGSTVWRVNVVDEGGESLAVVASARSPEVAEADWQWATGVLAHEFRKRAATPEKVASAFVALWNKTHAPKQPQPIAGQTPSSSMRDPKSQAAHIEGMERTLAEITVADDTDFKLCHIIDHFDTNGLPLPSASKDRAIIVGGNGSVTSAATVAVVPGSPLMSHARHLRGGDLAVRQMQMKKVSYALNTYRVAYQQPQCLPGYRQRVQRDQVLKQREQSQEQFRKTQQQHQQARPISPVRYNRPVALPGPVATARSNTAGNAAKAQPQQQTTAPAPAPATAQGQSAFKVGLMPRRQAPVVPKSS